MKESLADLQEVDPSAVQCRVDQDELTSAVTGEPRSDRHYRLNGSGNFVLLLCISIGGEGETGVFLNIIGSEGISEALRQLLWFAVIM